MSDALSTSGAQLNRREFIASAALTGAALMADASGAAPAATTGAPRKRQRGGAAPILTGIAANRSFVTGEAVTIADLVPGLALPDYLKMPSSADPVPVPPLGRESGA